jgi:hypothetical protein
MPILTARDTALMIDACVSKVSILLNKSLIRFFQLPGCYVPAIHSVSQRFLPSMQFEKDGIKISKR